MPVSELQDFRRLPAWWGLEGTSPSCRPTPMLKQGAHSSLPSITVAGWGWNLSRERGSTTSLGSRLQGSSTLTPRFFLIWTLELSIELILNSNAVKIHPCITKVQFLPRSHPYVGWKKGSTTYQLSLIHLQSFPLLEFHTFTLLPSKVTS